MLIMVLRGDIYAIFYLWYYALDYKRNFGQKLLESCKATGSFLLKDQKLSAIKDSKYHFLMLFLDLEER